MDKSLKNGVYVAFSLFLVGLALSACQKSQNSALDGPRVDISAPVKDMVVAKIGGTDVLYSDVQRAAAEQGLIKPTQTDSLMPLTVADYQIALDAVVNQKLLAQDAQRRADDTTPPAARRLATARERILSSIRVEAHIRETVTEEAMRKLYDTQAALADFGDEIRARHIVVESQEDALEVIKQLEDGEDFEALAADLSTDGDTRDRGGDLGYFTSDMLAPDFVGPLFEVKFLKGKANAQIAPFETGKGWHVAEILDRRRPGAKSYEDSREALRSFLTFDAIEMLMTDLREKNDVTLLPVGAPDKPLQTNND